MTQIIMNTVCNLKYTLEDTKQEINLNENNAIDLIESIIDVKKMIESIISNNRRQKQLKNLSVDQENFQLKLEDLKQSISSIRLLKPGSHMVNISIWEAEENEIETLVGCNYSDNFRTKIIEMDTFCTYLSDTMDIEYKTGRNINSKKECSFFQKYKKTFYIYWFNQSYGHLDQVRTDLEVSYNGQQEFLNTPDGAKLDTMWVQNEVNLANPDAPTVLINNPNGVFYENLGLFDDSFFSFYLKNGFNIFLWNYRGYGRSTGRISPDNYLRDGEFLVQHLVNVKGVTRLVVHGTSLGGAVACHLSNNPNVEFVFADRTFSSLDSVVRDDFGPILRFFYNLFTLGRWKMKASKAYLSCEKYKVLSGDPQDEMIPDLSSLKNGVARASLYHTINKKKKMNKAKAQFYNI